MTANREYELTVLVNGKPITEVEYNGMTYVEGRKNSVFELRLQNNTGTKVIMIPSVDGLNTIDGELCGLDSTGYVVGAYSSCIVSGWTVDANTAAKFIFKTQDGVGKNKTYAEAMDKSVENQGTIGILVMTEKPIPQSWTDAFNSTPRPPWGSGSGSGKINTTVYGSTNITQSASPERGVSPVGNYSANYSANITQSASPERGFSPQEEYTAQSIGTPTQDAPSLGTGFGKTTAQATKKTTFERYHKSAVALEIHYDSRANLKAVGVPVVLFERHASSKKKTAFPDAPQMGIGCKTPTGWHG